MVVEREYRRSIIAIAAAAVSVCCGAFAQAQPTASSSLPPGMPPLPPGAQVVIMNVDPTAVAANNGKLPELPPNVFLYVNSKDSAHLNAIVEKALRLAQRKRFVLQTIYHIGDHRTLSPENAALAQRLGIGYEAATKVAYSRGITMSPTWIFVKNGENRVVEGYSNIEPFIATEGLPLPAAKLDAMEPSQGELKGF